MTKPAADQEPSQEAPENQRAGLEYPVREYIGAMARELAHMARGDGDDALAAILDAAAGRAAQTGRLS